LIENALIIPLRGGVARSAGVVVVAILFKSQHLVDISTLKPEPLNKPSIAASWIASSRHASSSDDEKTTHDWGSENDEENENSMRLSCAKYRELC